MFRGLSAVNLDSKGRFAIPMRYRDILKDECAGQVILTIDTSSPCLLMYTLKQWEIIENKIQELPSFDLNVRRIQRLLIGHATELDIDANGRILIPSVLREYAKFEKSISLVGQGNKFEIWSDALWADFRRSWLSESYTDSKEVHDGLRILSI